MGLVRLTKKSKTASVKRPRHWFGSGTLIRWMWKNFKHSYFNNRGPFSSHWNTMRRRSSQIFCYNLWMSHFYVLRTFQPLSFFSLRLILWISCLRMAWIAYVLGIKTVWLRHTLKDEEVGKKWVASGGKKNHIWSKYVSHWDEIWITYGRIKNHRGESRGEETGTA